MITCSQLTAGEWLREAIRLAGGATTLAKGLGVTKQAIGQWMVAPAERVVAIESLTGVAREKLRPDIFEGARMPILHNPDNDHRIDVLYAVMSVDDEGFTGICAGHLPALGSVPLVTGSVAVLELMKLAAKAQLKGRTEKRLAVVKFARVEEEPEWL